MLAIRSVCVLTLVLFGWGCSRSANQSQFGRLEAQGVLSLRDGRLLLLVNREDGSADGCEPVSILESGDQGRSWSEIFRGERHLEFKFAATINAANLVLLGSHYCEGHFYDPFAMNIEASKRVASPTIIWQGPATIRSVSSREDQIQAVLLILPTTSEREEGSPVAYSSDDGGKTWKEHNTHRFQTKEGATEVVNIGLESGEWKVFELESGGFRLQRRLARESKWETVAEFAWRR